MSEKQYLYLLMQGECLIIQSQKQYEEMQQYSQEINEALYQERLLKERRQKIKEHLQAVGANTDHLP